MLPALVASLVMLVMLLLAVEKRRDDVQEGSRKDSLLRDLDGWTTSTGFTSFSDYRAQRRGLK
jgi:hypothetical protein